MNIKKHRKITIIGKLEDVEDAINDLQEETAEKTQWFVIESTPSTKNQNVYLVKLIKEIKND